MKTKDIGNHVNNLIKEKKKDKDNPVKFTAKPKQKKEIETLPQTEDDIIFKDIQKHPEKYIEVNMIRKDRLVDTFYIFSNKDKFIWGKKDYDVDPEFVYLIPTTKGYFIPSAFYREGSKKPRSFKNENKGIPCNALSLIYDLRLYVPLVNTENKNLNFFLIIISLAILVLYGITTYFNFGGTLG